MNAEDTLIQSAPGELVGALREIDFQVAHLRQRSISALGEYVAAQGWSTETHNINLDLASGMFTVSPKPQVEAA